MGADWAACALQETGRLSLAMRIVSSPDKVKNMRVRLMSLATAAQASAESEAPAGS